jgi:hypothetical protein
VEHFFDRPPGQLVGFLAAAGTERDQHHGNLVVRQTEELGAALLIEADRRVRMASMASPNDSSCDTVGSSEAEGSEDIDGT